MSETPRDTAEAARFERRLTLGTIAMVIVASTVLAYYDKFGAGVGVLFGTLVGYVVGRRR
jgi:hypothetical protein